VRISGLPPGRSLELVGLALDAQAAHHALLVIERCEGLVLLDGVLVHGSALVPGVELTAARCVAIQAGALAGAPALALRQRSRCSLRGLALEVEVEPGSLTRSCAAGPRFSVRERTLELEGAGQGVAWLLAAPRLGFSAPANPRVAGDLLLEHASLTVLGPPRALVDGRATWRSAGTEAGPYFQVLVIGEDVRPLVRFDRGLNPLVGLGLRSEPVPRKEEPREEEYEVPPSPSAPRSALLEGRAQPAG
jgi:hypothetical protein